MSDHTNFILEPADNKRLANLCGPMNEHIRQIEKRMGVEISNRSNQFQVIGDADVITGVAEMMKDLYHVTGKEILTAATVHLHLQQASNSDLNKRVDEAELEKTQLILRRGYIRGRGTHQREYLKNLATYDLSFGIGPAGTGKTYLAVASAVEALEQEKVQRLVLVRPAVEAGERLGFLPGDLAQKIDPYLRPMYDALYEMLGFQQVAKLMESNVIEVAPLAYMRGRSLNEAYILLDEAQNTTIEQMKMFLTRIGFGSKAVVTGDVTQIDLPRDKKSGLRHAIEVLNDMDKIGFTFFDSRDVVRHPMVQRIVEAYDRYDKQQSDD